MLSRMQAIRTLSRRLIERRTVYFFVCLQPAPEILVGTEPFTKLTNFATKQTRTHTAVLVTRRSDEGLSTIKTNPSCTLPILKTGEAALSSSIALLRRNGGCRVPYTKMRESE